MLEPFYTNQFKRDLRLMVKRGKRADKFKGVAEQLIQEQPLEPRLRNHRLSGEYQGRWECHLEPDWLLVYKLSETAIVFERTGTHADLFE